MAARSGGVGRTHTAVASIPTVTMATMVLIIKILVITPSILVGAPIGILLSKTLPVMRILLIPRIPPRSIPVIRSYDIDRSIGVIRSPSIVIAEKVIKDSIQKPIAVVIGPRCIRPNPRCRVRILGRGWIVIASITLSIRRCRHYAHRASSQQGSYHQNKN
jgi:hypothetical protein